MRQAFRGLFWMGVYAAVCLAPLAVVGVGGRPPGHGWVDDFSVALGFAGLAVMVLQFALVARFQHVAAPFGMDALLQFHRQIGYAALAFIVAHPVLLFVRDPAKLALLNFVTAPNRARCALAATVGLGVLVGTSVWRQRLRLSYEAWQLLHGVLAVAIVALALAHAALVGHYLGRPWQRALWLVLSAALVGLLGWVRLVKPLVHYRRPWRVEEVVPERGSAWTLVLRPDGHPGFRFEPGQFGWVMVGRSPFALTQHPFSFSSSAEAAGRLTLTIKARGDFTSSIAALKPGTRAYVDGPHGVFTTDRHEGPGFVLLAGGVGITPLISMLRTMADREDPRPAWLIYGNKDWESVTFREEIDALAARLRLTVVHVLEKPPAGEPKWAGETGYVNAALLRRHLPPKQVGRLRYFICGPGPMMDAVEHALVEVGVPDEHIHTERFEMV